MNKTIKVEEIPNNANRNSLYEILTNELSYFTHSFFKYPCKFIPPIPRWAINKYTKEGDFVMDCFAGSGTALVEAVLLKRNALGVDFDKLSQLLCSVKTSLLNPKDIKFIENNLNGIIENNKNIKLFTPDIHNINHWFSIETINELMLIKSNIENISNIKIKKFLLVCFASIIKKVSYADSNSPKPYISKRFPKIQVKAKDLFVKTVKNNVSSFKKYSDFKLGKFKIVAQDARMINNKKLLKKIDLVVTSPPYINAFDYVRSLRLENAWLNYFGDSNIINIKQKQIGTENISSKIYKKEIPMSNIKKLNYIIKSISLVDKKRAYVVYKFFDDMEKNLISIKRLLKNNAHYVIVVGNSKIRNIDVPTNEILIDIAIKCGYILENTFSYIIKNRYLRIPRNGRGGLIKHDWIIDLKNNK